MKEFHSLYKNSINFKENLYKGDYFVYLWDNGDAWSGYYGSRPELKRQIKEVFRAFRATEIMAGIYSMFNGPER